MESPTAARGEEDAPCARPGRCPARPGEPRGATRAAIDSIPHGASLATIEYDNTNDPTWAGFFDEMNPRRYLG